MSFTEMFEKQRAFMLHASTCTSQYDEPHRRLYGEILGLLDEAKQAERERDEAIDERDVLMEAHQALGHEYEMQGRALDDYRAKAIQRQQDFDGAAHGCDVLQGNLDALQADLDAALDEMLGVSLTREQWVRVQSLLEKRREENSAHEPR